MSLLFLIQGRRGRAWLVLLILAILALSTAAFVFLSERREPFSLDDLYGLLD
jgi:hypothetical protein